jgi:hypothetical protein
MALACSGAVYSATRGRPHVSESSIVGCCQAVRKDDVRDAFGFRSRYFADAPLWLNAGDRTARAPDSNARSARVDDAAETDED